MSRTISGCYPQSPGPYVPCLLLLTFCSIVPVFLYLNLFFFNFAVLVFPSLFFFPPSHYHYHPYSNHPHPPSSEKYFKTVAVSDINQNSVHYSPHTSALVNHSLSSAISYISRINLLNFSSALCMMNHI